MAQNNELAQIDAINKALTTLNGTLNNTTQGYLTLVKTIEANDKTVKASAQNEENLNKAKQETVKTTKQQDALDKELAASHAKLAKSQSEVNDVIQKNSLLISKNNAAAKDRARAAEAEEGSLVRMRLKLKELTAEYDKAGVRTKAMTNEINNLSKEISKAEEATNRGQRSVGQYGKMWEGLKGMLPVVSIAAVGTAIVSAFTAIKNSTGATADAFTFALKGMTNGLDFFWKTLATGDWSNFMKGMTDAITTGYKYAEMIDKIEDKTRGLSILEADLMQENIELEIQLRNRNLTPEQRLALGNKRIENEKKLVEERSRIAVDGYNNEVMLASQQTKLSEEQLMIVARDIRSQKKLDAETYQDRVEQVEKLRKLNVKTQGTGYGTISVQQADTPEIKALQATIDATDKGVVEYSGLLQRFDILTDQSKDKFVKSYVDKKQAEVSGLENTRKVYWLVNNMTKEISDNTAQANDTAAKATKKKTEEQIKAEQEAVDAFVKGMYDKMDAEAKFMAEQDKARADEVKAQDDLYKQLQDGNEEYLDAFIAQKDKETEAAQKAADDQKKIEEELNQAKIDLAVEAGNAIFEFRNMSLQKELDTLQVEKDMKLSNARLTTEQRAAIEADFEKKSNAIKAKQAKNDKLQALFNIGVSTAMAVMKAAAAAPPPANVPLIVAMSVLGALQAALVAAQPIPKYAKGTMSAADRFIAGEAGRELMMLRSGEIGIADKATYFEGNKFKGAKIFSNPETEKIIGATDRGIVGQQTNSGLIHELREVKKAILNKPVAIYDSNHKQIGLGDSKHQTIYLNRLTR